MKNWESIFGTGWAVFSENIPEIGAFLLDHKNNKLIADKNVASLLDVPTLPDYEAFRNIIDNMQHKDNFSQLKLFIAENDEEITAGYIGVPPDTAQTYSSQLPVYSYAHFISAITQDTANSLLALLQIENYSGAKLSGADIKLALTGIVANSPQTAILSAASKNRFWFYIPDFTDDKVLWLENLQAHMRKYIGENTEKHSLNLTFTAGCGADSSSSAQRMQTAEFALYEADAIGAGSVLIYSAERYSQQKADYENMKRFSLLIDNNLFTYHFQPIVSARNGEIYAYEALMRTDPSIGMYPLEILGAATKLGRLYDIEKATIRNSLSYISANQEAFAERKLFVNSIPAHILTTTDWDMIVNEYGELMEKMVIEMTEDSQMDNDRLAIIQNRLRRSNIQLAIDDYGTGYSNTTNLIRYEPNYVKIDRSLIEGINENQKMQKLVAGIMEFIHENGYIALAEGVETYEELKTMIELGADFIQGYYISKPKPFLLHEIKEDLKQEIVEINLFYSDSYYKVYHPAENEVVELSKLTAERYGSIFIEHDNITIVGVGDTPILCPITIKDDCKIKLTLKNSTITTERDSAVIIIGNNTELVLNVEGENKIFPRGIWVPQTSTLKVVGSGSLHVHAETMNSYGIGTDKDNSYGNILIECTGRLQVDSNGENAIAIGGGKNTNGSSIRILAGNVRVETSGGNCVGIGSMDGNSYVDIITCECSINCSATNTAAIGSLSGNVNLYIENVMMSITESGVNLCGIGVLNKGDGKIFMTDCTVKCDMHGRSIICVGTDKGDIDTVITSLSANFYCEGGSVLGIGDTGGDGNVNIREATIDMLFLTGDGNGIVSKNGTITTENMIENTRINP